MEKFMWIISIDFLLSFCSLCFLSIRIEIFIGRFILFVFCFFGFQFSKAQITSTTSMAEYVDERRFPVIKNSHARSFTRRPRNCWQRTSKGNSAQSRRRNVIETQEEHAQQNYHKDKRDWNGKKNRTEWFLWFPILLHTNHKCRMCLLSRNVIVSVRLRKQPGNAWKKALKMSIFSIPFRR